MAETDHATEHLDAKSTQGLPDQLRFPVWQASVGRDFFEKDHAPIVEFTDAFIAKNQENGIKLTQAEVEFYFECQVRSAYCDDKESPMIDKLLSQDQSFHDILESNVGGIPMHTAREVWKDMVKFTYFSPNEYANLITQKYSECNSAPTSSDLKPMAESSNVSSTASRKQGRADTGRHHVDIGSLTASGRGKNQLRKGLKDKANP